MNLEMIIKIILLIVLAITTVMIVRASFAVKYNNRLSKFVINKETEKNNSIGDYLYNLYSKVHDMLAHLLAKSYYYKLKSKSFDKYNYNGKNNNGLNIIATKFLTSIIFGLIYFISSSLNSNYSFMVMILWMLIGYLVYNVYLKFVETRHIKAVENDLLKAVVIMNNAFKSGFNITQAVDMVTKDLSGPISKEFKRIANDLKYGLEIKDVFERFYERVKIDDAKYITSSLSLLNLTGGNLVGIFSNIEKSFTNNKRIKDELNAMTSSSKLVYYILLFIPVVLTLTLILVNNTYFNPLFSSPIGIIIIVLIVLLYISYILIIKKILKVDYE